MSLRIQDFKNVAVINDDNALERTLQVRYADANSFWLTHDEEKKPAMSMLVRNDLSYVHYFPGESHPGFASKGSLDNLNRGGVSVFFMDSLDEEQQIPNAFVVPFSKALGAAREFFIHKELPSSIEWTKL